MHGRAEDRLLRNEVERYHGCPGSLDSRSQRLLSLRAGLHGSPRSAGAVARIMHISPAREQQLERRSLLALQTTGQRGCGGSPGTSQVASGLAVNGATPGSAAPGSAAPGSPAASSSSAASPAASGTGSHSVRAPGGRSARPVVITPSAIQTAEQAFSRGDPASQLKMLLAAMIVLAGGLIRMVRRRLPPALAGFSSAGGDDGRPVTRIARGRSQDI